VIRRFLTAVTFVSLISVPLFAQEFSVERSWSVPMKDVAYIAANGSYMYAFDEHGKVLRLNSETGRIVSTFNLPAGPINQPAIYRQMLFVPTKDGTLGAYSQANGSLKWSAGVKGAITAPSVWMGVVYVGAETTIHGFDVRLGSELFTTDVSSSVVSPPLVQGGAVYASTTDGAVVAVDLFSKTVLGKHRTNGLFYGQGLAWSKNGIITAPSGHYRAIERIDFRRDNAVMWKSAYTRPYYFSSEELGRVSVMRPAAKKIMLQKIAARLHAKQLGDEQERLAFYPTGEVAFSGIAVKEDKAAVVVREQGLPPTALYRLELINTKDGKSTTVSKRILDATPSLTCPAPVLTETHLFSVLGKVLVAAVALEDGSTGWEEDVKGGITAGPLLHKNRLAVASQSDSVIVWAVRLPMTLPQAYSFRQIRFNPLNRVLNFEYALPKDVKVSIKVFDAMGREVAQVENRGRKAGIHNAVWNRETKRNKTVAAGTYLVLFKAGSFRKSLKMTLIR